jgi:hypothetical protein
VPANPNQQAYVIDVHREEDSAQFHAETYGPYPVVGWHIRRDDGTGATAASPILPVWVRSDRSTRGQLMDGNVSERKGEVS